MISCAYLGVSIRLGTALPAGARPSRQVAEHKAMSPMEKVNLSEKLSEFTEHWSPRIVGELNGQHVKLVKLRGEFVWHHHEAEDELFLVLKGALTIHLRDKSVHLEPGEFFIVPSGVEHKPVADSEAAVLLFEPASTLNTGQVRNELTVIEPERI